MVGCYLYHAIDSSYMSQQEQLIVCRRCSEAIPLESSNCPHCGVSIRSTKYMIAAIVVGALILGASLTNISELTIFALLGVALVVVGGYFLYDRRRRRKEAMRAEEGLEKSFGTTE